MLTTDDIALIQAALQPEFDRIDARFTTIDERFDRVDARFDRVDRKLMIHDDNFRVIARRLDKQDGDLEDFAATTVSSFTGLENRLDDVADDVLVIKDIVKDHGFRLARLEHRRDR